MIKKYNVDDNFCLRPKNYFISNVHSEESSDEVTSLQGKLFEYKAKKNDGFEADFGVHICEEVLIGYITKENSKDDNRSDLYFLFGKREGLAVKGLFVSSTRSGKFYIDVGYRSFKILLIDDFVSTSHHYTVPDNKMILKQCTYTNSSLKQALTRVWPYQTFDGVYLKDEDDKSDIR